MKKMYFEINNGNNGILIENDGKWMYFDASEIPVDISEYTDGNRNIDAALYRIRAAINSGDLYGLDDFIDEYSNDEKHAISEFDGMTIDDIDEYINYENGIPKNHDLSAWYEI